MIVKRSAAGTTDLNSTCNVLHVPRSKSFNVQSLFSGPALNQIARGFGSQGGGWLGDPQSDVVACTSSKDINAPAGVISLHLKPDKGYLDRVFAGDLLFVFMDDAGTYDPTARFSSPLVTVAIVDGVHESVVMQGGVEQLTVAISARDMTMLFINTSTTFDQAFAQIEQALFSGAYIQQVTGRAEKAASPAENVISLLRLIYDFNASNSSLIQTQWRLNTNDGSTVPLISMLDISTFVQVPLFGYALPDAANILQASNVWTLLEGFANRVVNEFFIDVRDLTPAEAKYRQFASALAKQAVSADDVVRQQQFITDALQSPTFRETSTQKDDGTSVLALVLRQRPYDSKSFAALPATYLDETEVESVDTSRTGHDVFNWFRMRFPTLPPAYQEFIQGVLINPQSVSRFGFQRMEAETRYMFASSDLATKYSRGQSKQDFGDVFNYYTELLGVWHAANEAMLTRQATVRFSPRIRVGTRLRTPYRGKLFDFYVQGVQHAFHRDAGASRTSLTLTRGVEVDGNQLQNYLLWDGQHMAIPASFGQVYGRVTMAGFNQAGAK